MRFKTVCNTSPHRAVSRRGGGSVDREGRLDAVIDLLYPLSLNHLPFRIKEFLLSNLCPWEIYFRQICRKEHYGKLGRICKNKRSESRRGFGRYWRIRAARFVRSNKITGSCISSGRELKVPICEAQIYLSVWSDKSDQTNKIYLSVWQCA